MSSAVTRIFSDLHYGDRASRVVRLTQLRPLLDGVSALVLNGDSLDTRPGPVPAATTALRDEVLDFFARETPSATLLTGNHDADISPHHSLDLADGRVFAVHGDILFENIVPWGKDAPYIGRLIAENLATLPPPQRELLPERLALWRRIAAKIPQRHQSERRSLRYALGFASDTFWPPLRVLRILNAWREEPGRAAKLRRQHRPNAQVVLTGHTHRPGAWRLCDSGVLINTGSFCPPFGGWAVDLTATHVTARQVVRRNDEFRLGDKMAEFPLATA